MIFPARGYEWGNGCGTIPLRSAGQVAQLVEQWTENPCVAGSIPALSISSKIAAP